MKKLFLHTSLSILLILPLYSHAESTSTTLASSTHETSSSTENREEQHNEPDFTECQQQAIETRDTKIAESRSVYNTAMTAALTERKNKEKAAVADKENKKSAIKASVDGYKNLVKKAQNDLTDARKIAWQSFEEDIQKCHDVENVKNDEISKDEEKDTGISKDMARTFSADTKKETKEPVVENEGPSFKSVIKAIKSLFD